MSHATTIDFRVGKSVRLKWWYYKVLKEKGEREFGGTLIIEEIDRGGKVTVCIYQKGKKYRHKCTVNDIEEFPKP